MTIIIVLSMGPSLLMRSSAHPSLLLLIIISWSVGFVRLKSDSVLFCSNFFCFVLFCFYPLDDEILLTQLYYGIFHTQMNFSLNSLVVVVAAIQKKNCLLLFIITIVICCDDLNVNSCTHTHTHRTN